MITLPARSAALQIFRRRFPRIVRFQHLIGLLERAQHHNNTPQVINLSQIVIVTQVLH